MDETPNDSGEFATSPGHSEPMVQRIEMVDAAAPTGTVAESGPPAGAGFGEIVRRPSVWGLFALIAFVLVVQVWLLFL